MQSVGWNECEIIAKGNDDKFRVEFFDDLAVVVGYNATTGDYLIMNYVGETSHTPVYTSTRAKYKQFFEANGEKYAFMIGCNNGGGFAASAQEFLKSLNLGLNANHVTVLTIPKEQLSITAGYGKYHYLYFTPSDGNFRYEDNGTKGIDFEPFEIKQAEFPSNKTKFDFIADLLSYAELKMDIYSCTFDNDADRASRANYLKSISHRPAFLTSELSSYALDLKKYFEPQYDEQSSALVPQNAVADNKFAKTLSQLAKNADNIFSSFNELLRGVIPSKAERDIEIIKGNLEKTFANLYDIAVAEKIDSLIEPLKQRRDTLRNMRALQLE